jgi:asparagine synthase (glutamine-hydrolysing)
VSIARRVEQLLSPRLDRVDQRSVAAQICGYAPKPGSTFFTGAKSLPAGCILAIDRNSFVIRKPDEETLRSIRPRGEAAAANELHRTLLETVVDYAPGDGPVGITLSSGLDSTSLAAGLRAQRPDARMVAFIWTARSVPEADESAPATRVAQSLGMEIVEIPADKHHPLSSPDGITPSIDSPACNMYREVWRETFRVAKNCGIRNLWTGQGGDAGFGGVFPFSDLFLTGRWFRLVKEVNAYRRRIEVDLPWLIRYRILGRSARWLIPRRHPSPPPWIGPNLRSLIPDLSRASRFDLPGDQERKRLLDNPRRFSATALMTDEAAEFGIDLRNPWLDPRLIGLARSLPAYWTFVDGVAKAPVRRAMRGLLPDETLDRSDKIYPEPIFERALRGPGRASIETLLLDMRAADLGFVEPKPLRRAIDEYAEGKRRGALFWHSVTLEAWLRRLAG